MEKIFKSFRAEVKGIDLEAKTAIAVITTGRMDRDGEVVEPSALTNRLGEYKAHPVLLSSHNYYDLRKQIGEAVSITLENGKWLVMLKWYAGAGNQEADWGWFLATKGIAAFSIGFQVHGWEDRVPDEKNAARRIFRDIEILEISQVLIPSNRDALLARSVESELCEMAMKSVNFDEVKIVDHKPAAHVKTLTKEDIASLLNGFNPNTEDLKKTIQDTVNQVIKYGMSGLQEELKTIVERLDTLSACIDPAVSIISGKAGESPSKADPAADAIVTALQDMIQEKKTK
jgi:hypothetical protein